MSAEPPWTPWPTAENVPACWTWPVPPVRDVPAELAAAYAAAAHLPVDDRHDPGVLEMIYGDDPGFMRWQEFHSGVRVAVDSDAPDRCAICGRVPPRGRRMVDDHCHATGQIRGRLCAPCNTREGRSDAAVFRRYRAWHPAAILDAHEMYTGFYWLDGWNLRVPGPAGMRPPTPWPPFTDPLD